MKMHESTTGAGGTKAETPSRAPHPAHFFDPANAVTLMSLAGAVACISLALAGHIHLAVVALIGSGLCDLFDGVVARRMRRDNLQRAFGEQLDSLVDACAFGMAPAVLLHASGLSAVWFWPVLLFIPVSVVWRLAFFHVVPMTERAGRKYFHGLPCTYVALILPMVYLLGIWLPQFLLPSLAGMAVLLCLAMWSHRPVPKPSGKAYVFFAAMALVATVVLLWKGGAAF